MTKTQCSATTSEVSLGSTPSNFNIHWFRHMLLSDAAADDYGEDEGYYCRLTYLLHGEKKNQRTQTDPLLLSASCFSRQQRQSIQIITNICSFYSSGPKEASFPANAPCGGLICFPWDGGGTVQIKADPVEFTTSSDIQAPWANVTVRNVIGALHNYMSISYAWRCIS